MQELDNTTAHYKFLTKFCKLLHALTATRISVTGQFADSTFNFNGFELNLKVFYTFLSDIYSWFDNVFFLFSSSVLYDFTVP